MFLEYSKGMFPLFHKMSPLETNGFGLPINDLYFIELGTVSLLQIQYVNLECKMVTF